MRRAIERHEAGTACVIPIIVRPADWSGAPFADLQVLPKHAKPVTQWQNRDAAWLEAVEGIRRAVGKLGAGRRASRPQQPEPSAPTGSPAPSAATAAATGGARAIRDAENGTVLSGRLVRAEGDPPTEDPAVNEAYDALDIVRDFFARLGRRRLRVHAPRP